MRKNGQKYRAEKIRYKFPLQTLASCILFAVFIFCALYFFPVVRCSLVSMCMHCIYLYDHGRVFVCLPHRPPLPTFSIRIFRQAIVYLSMFLVYNTLGCWHPFASILMLYCTHSQNTTVVVSFRSFALIFPNQRVQQLQNNNYIAITFIHTYTHRRHASEIDTDRQIDRRMDAFEMGRQNEQREKIKQSTSTVERIEKTQGEVSRRQNKAQTKIK